MHLCLVLPWPIRGSPKHTRSSPPSICLCTTSTRCYIGSEQEATCDVPTEYICRDCLITQQILDIISADIEMHSKLAWQLPDDENEGHRYTVVPTILGRAKVNLHIKLRSYKSTAAMYTNVT
jgi:hypothetical protein